MNHSSVYKRLNAPPAKALAARAFTLIELLVVIAIIGILAALILSATSHAKARGESIQCLSNTRQLIQGWTMHADDHDGELMPNTDGQDGKGVFTNWVAGYADTTNRALLTDQSQTLLALYVENPLVYKCPGDKTSRVRSLSMNCRLNPLRPGGGLTAFVSEHDGYWIFRKLPQIQKPSDVFVFLDERYDSINDGYFAVDMSNTGNIDGEGVGKPFFIIDYPASYHNEAGNVTFADGHSEHHRWVEPTTNPPLGRARPRSYTSAADRDVGWLQRHATYPQ